MIDENSLLRKLDAHMVIQVHDEIILDCPQENAEQFKERLQKIMRNSKYKYQITVPMDSDAEVVYRWGETAMTEELKVEFLKLKENNKPLEELYERFPNFPQDSIKRVFDGIDEVIRF